jgi:curved DNA-binding protein CbpA
MAENESDTGYTDYYAALGVPSDASQPQIASAFRRQARTWHPDARPEDSGAAARFRQVVDAYRVLADPRRRGEYDRARARAAARQQRRSAGGQPGAERRQPGEQPGKPPPSSGRSGRGRPVQVRYISRADDSPAASTSGKPAQHTRQGQSPRRGPHIVPLSPYRSFPDDTLRDLIGRLRSLLYDRW